MESLEICLQLGLSWGSSFDGVEAPRSSCSEPLNEDSFNKYLLCRKSGRQVWKLPASIGRELVKIKATNTEIHKDVGLCYPFCTSMRIIRAMAQ